MELLAEISNKKKRTAVIFIWSFMLSVLIVLAYVRIFLYGEMAYIQFSLIFLFGVTFINEVPKLTRFNLLKYLFLGMALFLLCLEVMNGAG